MSQDAVTVRLTQVQDYQFDVDFGAGIPALRWLAVWGRTDEPQPRVGVFLVPRESAGIRVIESWDHLGLQA